MQSLRLLQTHDLRLTNGPTPTPATGEVLVKVTAAGVCGTDRHLYHGEFPCTPPVTLGHEFSGTIVTSDDPTLPIGAHIACDPNIACHTCPPCLRGRPNLCTRLSAIGVHRDGGFAEFVAMPAHRAFTLPSGLDPLHAALAEPLACTLHGTDLADIKPGMRAIVIGGGVIGLMALQLLRASGASVMMVTRSDLRRKLAEDLGAEATAATPEAALQHWPDGADAVLECAGTTPTVEAASHLTAKGGRAVILGVLPAGSRASIDPLTLLTREIDLRFSFLNPFTMTRALVLLANGTIAANRMITRTVPLADLAKVITEPAGPADIRVLALP
jgi:L-iditol 2-dehydrogenase